MLGQASGHINILLQPEFFFFWKKTLLLLLFSLRLPQGLSYLCVSHPSRFVFGFRFWIVLLCLCVCVIVLLCLEQGVSIRGGTRPTHCVWGVATAISIFKRVGALPMPTLLPARGLVCLLLSLSVVLIYVNIYIYICLVNVLVLLICASGFASILDFRN